MKNRSVTFRRFLPALLIVPYLAYLVGMFSPYISFFHRSTFQARVVELNQESLTTLVVSSAEFEKIKWTEAHKEFEYFGKMYDVSKIEQNGNQYSIYCENDSFEDLFIDWLKSASKSKSKVMPQIQFVEPLVDFECMQSFQNIAYHDCFEKGYLSILRELISPPPRFS